MPKSYRKIVALLCLLLIGSGLTAYTKYGDSRQAAKSSAPALLTRAALDLIRHSDREIIFEWECPEITLDRDPLTGQIVGIDIPGAAPYFETGIPRLAELSQLIDCPPGHVGVQILEMESETRLLGEMAPTPDDVMIDEPGPEVEGWSGKIMDEGAPRMTMTERRALTPLKTGLQPPEPVTLTEAGIYRGHRLMNARVFPVQVNAQQGTARVIRRIRVRVTLPEISDSAVRLPDRATETSALRRMLGPLAETALPTRMTEAFEGRGEQSGRLDEPIGGRWKLIVDTEGIIRITAADLEFALCPVDQITPYDTHIHNRGQEIPIHFVGGADGRFDEHDYIDFYAVPNRQTYSSISPSLYQDFWTKENVYYLSWGDGQPGLRLAEEDGTWKTGSLWGPSRVKAQNYVRVTVHTEQDSKMDLLSRSGSLWASTLRTQGPFAIFQDQWFWGDWISALGSRTFPVGVTLPYTRISRNVGVRAALQGLSWGEGVAADGHHRAMVSLNNVSAPGLTVGKVSAGDNNVAWTDQNPIILQTNPADSVGIVTADLVQSGNTMRVTVTGDGLAGTKDKIYVNWFEVDYDRDLRATIGAYLKFPFDTTRGDTFSFDIRQFSSPPVEVWKLGHSRLTNCDTRWIRLADEGASYHTRFQLITDRAYEILAFDQDYPKPPKAILPEYGTRDLRNRTGAEYLIIYHDSFADEPSLKSLDSLRRVTFNGSVDTFRISEVYDQFSHGIVNPEAIHRFLKYAYENWPVRPTHVCLIGDGLLNNRSTFYAAGYLIPSLYVPTVQYGLSSAEVLFGCVSGPPSDILPDIAVGRISCRSAAELDVYVEKLLRYEDPTRTDYTSPYHSRFLFVNDKRDGQFNFDREFAEPAIKLLPDYCNISRVYLDSLPAGQGRTTLRNAFRDGAVIVNYNGHGGGGLWSGTTLMDVPTVALLNNAHAYPFITNFTCYVGSFDANEQGEVLGEAFLFSRNSRLDPVGGIGVYSTVSVGWARNGAYMQTRLFDFISDLPPLTLGEIVQINKIRYWGSQQLPDISQASFAMMMNMTLLGDPGVRLALPQQLWSDVRLDSNIVNSADTIYVSGTLPWDPQGNVTNLYVMPYNGDFRTYESSFLYTDRSKTPAFNTTLILPEIVRSRTFDSVLVPIGPAANRRFVSAMGHVVVYATFPGTETMPPRDAIASIPIYHADSLGDLRMFNLEILPRAYVPNDSLFRIEVGLTHRHGIQSARLRGVFRPAQGPVVLDTVSLSLTPEGRWQSPDLGPHRVFGGQYRLQIFARPFGEDEVSTPEQILSIEQRPDFGISTSVVAPLLYPGDVPEYSLRLTNSTTATGQRPAEIILRLTGVHDTTYFDSTLGRVVTVPADSFVSDLVIPDPGQEPPLFEARVPAPFRAGAYRVTLMLDPDSLLVETNENNNRYQTILSLPHIFPADNVLGTYLPRRSLPVNEPHIYWRSAIRDTVRVQVLPGSLPSDRTSLIYKADSLSAAAAARLAPIGLYPVATGLSVPTFRVTLADTSELLAGGGTVRVSKTFSGLADSIGVTGLALFVKRADSDAWLRLINQTVEYMRRDTTYPPGGGIQIRWRGRLSGDAPGLGSFGVFRHTDTRAPDITISAEGLRFTPHSILPRQPEIYILLSDLSGIDRSPGRFFLVLDNDTIPEAEIGWSDSSGWGASMNAVFRPRLEPGSHVLSVTATDNLGNTGTTTAEFEVRGTFGIEWAINYPNPFQKNTVISYALTDVTDDFVEVKIFTVSGRHIKTLREGTRAAANYREISWDGTDLHGGEVANGVYFAKIKAKQGNQEVEKIVKLAKVR